MADWSLTAIDIGVIAVFLISAVFATLRGLIHETFAILAWVAGAYVALRFTPSVQPLLHGVITPPWLERAAVLAGIFLLVFIPLAILSGRLSAKVKSSMAGTVDRMLGLIFGVGRGLLIVGVAYIAFGALVPPKNYPATLTKARLFPVIRTTGEMLRALVPDETAVLPSGNSASGYGANGLHKLERLFQAPGGSSSSSR